ncbi:helix-turn-helix domain-containing protein [Sphingopyxis sp.]|uniref:helix-turn-helix domain-containing protein n=1 Tax=Sphingopyxis sp. TaxID=1908224 RepID=UPI00311F2AD8
MAENDAGKELRDIKMLLILQLLNDGVKQRQIALALGVSEATVSRLLPKGMTSGAKAKAKGADE